MGGNVAQLAGNRLLVEIAGAGIEQAMGQRRQPCLAGRIIGAAGAEIDLHVQNRQLMGLGEINAGARRRQPMFDLDACVGQADRGGKQDDDQVLHVHSPLNV